MSDPHDFGRKVLRLFTDPQAFGCWFAGASWRAWHAVLHGIFGIAPEDSGLAELLTQATQRASLPSVACAIAVLVIGRGGGKSMCSSFLACCFALRDYSAYLAPGERATIMLLAADRRQARVLMRYIRGFFKALPMLSALIERETNDGLDLTNGVTIEIHTASFRSLRGYRVVCCICDEISYWSIDGANPDREIVTALGPALARTPGSLLILISSPFARKGELWRFVQQYFGKDNSNVFVVNASTLVMNPTFDAAAIERAFEDDAVTAASEYGTDGRVEFRKDIESLLTLELLERVVIPGRGDLPYAAGAQCTAFFDGSGGTTVGGDSATIAIGHREGDRLVIDLIRETKPPFDPEVVVSQFAMECKKYRVRRIVGDRFAGSWPQAAFRKHGIEYVEAELTKTDLYREAMPMFSSGGRVELPDNAILKKQLLGLERRVTASGREQIDHGPQKGQHDDVSNVVVGVLQELRDRVAEKTVEVIMPENHGRDDDWRRPFFGLPPRRASGLPAWMVPAPVRQTPSDEMQRWRQESEEAEARAHEEANRSRAHMRQLAKEAAAEQQQRDQQARWKAMGFPTQEE